MLTMVMTHKVSSESSQKFKFLSKAIFSMHAACIVWQYGFWSFQMGGTKLERFLPKDQYTQRKLLNLRKIQIIFDIEN